MKRILIMLAILFGLNAEVVRAAQADWPDGDYEIAVTMSGGSGRASIDSPTKMRVQDGVITVQIRFSSPNYDYMRVGEQTYYPVNTEGNSVFEISAPVFDAPMEIVADTTAMSTPHEIKYTLVFDSRSVTGGTVDEQIATKNLFATAGRLAGAVAAGILIVSVIVYMRGRKKDHAA